MAIQITIIAMDYAEFLKLPEISVDFDSMYQKQKEYFSRRYSKSGFDKEEQEILSIKSALITTDLHFSEIHESESRK